MRRISPCARTLGAIAALVEESISQTVAVFRQVIWSVERSHQRTARRLVIVGGIGLLAASTTQASIIFDNFNTNEGNYNQAPNFSSTSTVTAASTADRITTDSIEGAGSEKLVLNAPASGTVRCRFLSNSGTPGTQQSFTVSSATTDGFIGFYYKVIGSGNGLQFGMNLDSPANSGTTMVGGVLKNATADGNWHVVEWNLDSLSDWGQVNGIGGAASNLETAGDNPHTIDSIYFYNMAVNSTTTVEIDFVAKSDSGSIAGLVPEPTSLLSLATFGSFALRRRSRAR